MGPIQKALFEIKRRIPRRVLEEAFLQPIRRWSPVPTDIDTIIRDRVIDNHVMVDCNLYGGLAARIDLSSLPRSIPDQWSSLWNVPPDFLQGRTITSVSSVSYGYGYSIAYSNYNPWFDQMMQEGCGNAGVLTEASQLWSAASNMPIVATARVSSPNVNAILVQDQVRIPDRCYVFCRLSHDTEMTNLKPEVWLDFADLCVLATKSYIYYNMIVELNEGRIDGGYELGVIKDTIDSYSDADQMYHDFLNETWYKVSHMQDDQTRLKVVRNMLGAGN